MQRSEKADDGTHQPRPAWSKPTIRAVGRLESIMKKSRLPEREQRILRLRFAKKGGLTLRETGQRVGLSFERVRQLENGALARINWRILRDTELMKLRTHPELFPDASVDLLDLSGRARNIIGGAGITSLGMLEDYLSEKEYPPSRGYYSIWSTKLDLHRGCGLKTVDTIRCELARIKRLANIADEKPVGAIKEKGAKPKPIREMSVDALDISTRARNVLRSARISTIGDLEKQLVEIGHPHHYNAGSHIWLRIYRGCGPKTAGIIRQGLAELKRSMGIH